MFSFIFGTLGQGGCFAITVTDIPGMLCHSLYQLNNEGDKMRSERLVVFVIVGAVLFGGMYGAAKIADGLNDFVKSSSQVNRYEEILK